VKGSFLDWLLEKHQLTLQKQKVKHTGRGTSVSESTRFDVTLAPEDFHQPYAGAIPVHACLSF
jgi:hypothetical protein